MSIAVLASFGRGAYVYIHTERIMNRGILYLSCLLLVVFTQQGHATIECYSCEWSDFSDDTTPAAGSCVYPDDTTPKEQCDAGCYAMDTELYYNDSAGDKAVARVIYRGCASPLIPAGGCLKGKNVYDFWTTYLQSTTAVGPTTTTGYVPGPDVFLCSCTKNLCNKDDHAHAAYECFQCSYSDLNAADEETCSSPNLNETSIWTECPVGCYDFDAVFKINDGGVTKDTRYVLRGCADSNYDVGGCFVGKDMYNHFTKNIQPYGIGPPGHQTTGYTSGSVCSCATKKKICNAAVRAVQPTIFLVGLLVFLTGYFMA